MNKPLEINNGDKILISRTDKLGDLILALPFIETFKHRYPDCKIDVMASLYASPILENNSSINKILRVQNDQLINNKLYKKDLLRKIIEEKYKGVIVLYPERHISNLYYKADIPIRIGTAGRFHSVFFNTRLLHSRKKNLKHEFLYNLDFLKFFKDGMTVTKPRVYLKENELANARRILQENGVSGKFVVLHPGSGGSAESWSLGNFIKLYEHLEKKGLVLVVSGSESEGFSVKKSSAQHNIPINTITGATDMRTLAAVLSMAEVVVANSTGPLHLAVAVGTKVVGLYPSRKAMSPVRWGPLGADDRVILPVGAECSCPTGKCTCMEMIKPEIVAEDVLELLNDEPL